MFFTKLAVTLALVAPLASALSIITPTNWTSTDTASLQWTAAAGDPQSFSIELINQQFNRQFALANNVPTGQMGISLTLPVVPVGGGYTIQLVDIGNVTQVFAESGEFEIGASTASSTTSSSATATLSRSKSASVLLTSSTATHSGGASSATTFNNGAVALGIPNANLASFAVMVSVVLAGAGFLTL